MKITIQVDGDGRGLYFRECPREGCTWSVLGTDEYGVHQAHQAHVNGHWDIS